MKPHAWFSLVLSVFTTLALAATSFAQPQTVPHELAQRLIGSGATLFIGELPPENRLGFDFPLPQKTRVMGASASTEADPSYRYVTLFLSTQQPVADVKAFYRQAFRNLGWRMGQTYQQTGFLPSGEGGVVDTMPFCRSRGNRATESTSRSGHDGRPP